jgi:hypothetical protein
VAMVVRENAFILYSVGFGTWNVTLCSGTFW